MASSPLPRAEQCPPLYIISINSNIIEIKYIISENQNVKSSFAKFEKEKDLFAWLNK
jgi:hypothetical protein